MTAGSLTVISGFSGVGKGSVMKSLVSRYEGYALSVSATSRAPREGERDGVEYFFLTREAFETLIARDGLIEYTQYCDNYYGTPRAFVEEKLREGRDVLLEIEIEGAMNIRRLYPTATLVFVMPPSAQALMERLTGRKTETQEAIRKRVLRAAQEAEGIEDYDFILVNDRIDPAADTLHRLIQSRKLRTGQNEPLISQIQGEIREMAGKIDHEAL